MKTNGDSDHFDLLRCIPDAVIVMNMDYRVVFINRAAEDVYGIPAADAIGRRINEVIELVSENISRPEILKAALEEGCWRGEVQHRTKCIDRVWVDQSVSKCDLGNGESGFLAVMRVIDSHKQIEKLWRECAEKHIVLLEESPDPIFSLTREGQYLYVNQAFAAGVGKPVAGIIGQAMWDVFPKDEADKRFAALSDVFTTGRQKVIEVRVPRADGDRYYVTTITPIISNKDGGVEVTSAICSSKEITTRKNLEEALRESEAQFRGMVEAAPFAMMVSSGVGLKTEYLNSKFIELFGYTMADVPSTSTWLELAYPDEEYRRVVYGEWNRRIQESLETGVPVEPMEVVITCKDGSQKYIAAGYRSFGDRTLAYGINLTDQKKAEADKARLEEQLQQAMKMEAVGRLAGGVAHDFNNLLTGIMGNVSMALLDVKSDERLIRRLNEVNKAAERAASLTNQLLAFSRKQIIEPKVLNLNDVIWSLQRMLERLIGENIELKTMAGDNLGAVKVDQGQFEQIVVNLVVNARDAMPDGGKVLIKTSNIELDDAYCAAHAGAKPGRYVMLSVSDTGCGMSAEVLGHLYEPFFTTKPQGKGTGLGLATTYGAVQQAGGSIEVNSTEGKGTTFSIYIPRVDQPTAGVCGRGGVQSMPHGTETILLVEDEAIVLQVAVLILEKLGYHVLSAVDGLNALKVAEAYDGHIDLMMTDIVMPGMNGYHLAGLLKQIRPDTKVLFTSGYMENVISSQGIIDDGFNFIAKPYLPDDLAKKLREVLDGGDGNL